jgi:hypothetical protein
MRTLILLIAVLTVAAVIFVPRRWQTSASSPVIVSQGPTVEKLQRLSHLVTTKVLVADVLVGEGEGHVGAWLIKGDALLGVDLSRAKIVVKDDTTKHATIQLPTPELLTSRVDHQRTQTWQVRKTAWMPWSGDGDKLRDQVMREAQKLIAQAAGSREYIDQSKSAAEAIIAAFYSEVGWSVDVRWATEPSVQTTP